MCQIRTIFDSVFTGVDNARLYFVMGTQFVNSWLTQQRLWNNNRCVGRSSHGRGVTAGSLLSSHGRRLFHSARTCSSFVWQSQCVHGIAVGAYFGLGKNSTGGTIEPPQVEYGHCRIALKSISAGLHL